MTQWNYTAEKALEFIGMERIVVAEIYGVDNHRPLDAEMERKREAALALALSLTDEELAVDPILEGYRDCLRQIGRSVKKFPPSAAALMSIVRRTGRFPDINPIVNIYNAHVVENKLSLGVHDIDKLDGPIRFRISQGGETFVPIGGGEKITGEGDFLYADNHTVLAWLDARDSELVKIGEETQNLMIVAQGNAAASVDYRIQAVSAVCQDIVRCCGGSWNVSTVELTV